MIGYQYFEGVDLLAIEGFSFSTLLTFMSEIGLEGMKKFATAKQSASFLRLTPNNKKLGVRLYQAKCRKEVIA